METEKNFHTLHPYVDNLINLLTSLIYLVTSILLTVQLPRTFYVFIVKQSQTLFVD